MAALLLFRKFHKVRIWRGLLDHSLNNPLKLFRRKVRQFTLKCSVTVSNNNFVFVSSSWLSYLSQQHTIRDLVRNHIFYVKCIQYVDV